MTDVNGGIDHLLLSSVATWLLIAVVAGTMLWRSRQASRVRDEDAMRHGIVPDADGAIEYPIRGILTRAGFLQGAQSTNSINPRFWVERDAVRLRILKTWHLPFSELLQVDARELMSGTALIFQVAEGKRAFVVRFGHAGLAREALSRVSPAVPLTEAAALLRDGDARAATAAHARYRGPMH